MNRGRYSKKDNKIVFIQIFFYKLKKYKCSHCTTTAYNMYEVLQQLVVLLLPFSRGERICRRYPV